MCGRISWKANGVIKFAEAVIFAGSGSYLVVDKEERDGEYAKNIKVIWWIKSLLASYIVTGILLLVLTFFMYKFELNEKLYRRQLLESM